MSSLEEAIRAIHDLRPRSVVAFTGAGVSAGSGIPTFRGPGGLWRNFRPEELATPEAFRRDPALVWSGTSGAAR
jgi:NAD-dependent deacetylase